MRSAAGLLMTAWIALLVTIGAVAVFAYLALGTLQGGSPPLAGFFASILVGNVAVLVLRFSLRARRKISPPPAR